MVLGKRDNSIVVGFVDHGVAGKLTLKEIVEELYDLADRRQKQALVLDFSGVVSVSSATLEKLLALELLVETKGGSLRLSKVGPEVKTILAAKKLDHMFQIEEDRGNGSKVFAYDRSGIEGPA